jgi:hypothetical protein
MKSQHKVEISSSGRVRMPRWLYVDTKRFMPKVQGLDETYIYFDMENLSIVITGIQSAYWACNWYPHLKKKKVPVIKSKILDADDFQELIKKMSKYIKKYEYVRTCNSSPRDIINFPIFDNAVDAYASLISSPRVIRCKDEHGHFHIFMRKKVEVLLQSRCFIFCKTLRAVSLPEDLTREYVDIYKRNVVEFFGKYVDDMLYSSCIIDICMIEDTMNVIKIYPYHYNINGKLFDWDKDSEILFNSEEPIFRQYSDKRVSFSKIII